MARNADGGFDLSNEEMIKKVIRDNLEIRVDFRSEYGSGGSKRLEIQLRLDGDVISEEAVYITEGKWESSW